MEYAKPGAVMDIDVRLAVEGHQMGSVTPAATLLAVDPVEVRSATG